MAPPQMTAVLVKRRNQVELTRAPRPSPGPTEVLVRVSRCGICGTDLEIVSGAFAVPRLPLVLGHECAGVVAKVGERVPHLQPGQRVTVDPIMPCGTCQPCRRGTVALCDHAREIGIHRQGALAEYLIAPASNAHALPPAVTDLAGALVEPLACAIHGQDRAGTALGDTVVVIGAGFQGLLHTLLARLRGAARVIVSARHQHRRQQAGSMGADLVLDADAADVATAILEATGGSGANVVVEASGSVQGLEAALRVVAKGGRLLIYGAIERRKLVRVSPFEVFERELSIFGSFGATGDTWPRAIDLIASGRLDPTPAVDAEWDLREGPAALAELRANRDILKGVIRVDEEGASP